MGFRETIRLAASVDSINDVQTRRAGRGIGDVNRARIGSSPSDLASSSSDLELWERRPEPASWSANRALVASGMKINLRNADDIMGLRNRVYTEWQNDAWAYYDAIGEIKYGFGIVGACMSRLKLYPAVVFDEDAVPLPMAEIRNRQRADETPDKTDDQAPLPPLPANITTEVMQYADRLMRDLRSGNGVSGLLRMFALNLSVAGECYLVRIKNRWYIKSTSELIVNQGGQIILRSQRAGSSTTTAGTVYGDIVLPSNTFIARIWREHPRYSSEPESSMLGLREACDELITLQRMIRTVARSRMNAGILYIPDGLSAAGESVAEDIASEEEEQDALVAGIYDSITTPITDETSAASVVPMMVTGPGDESKNIRYIEINRQVDQWLTERLDKTLSRILQGLDLPKNVVTGYENVKYNNARHMTDAMYSEHIEPMALLFCDAITMMYLRPMLKRSFPQLTDDDLDAVCIWYDPSELVIKPDDSAAADKGFDNFAIGADAWRRANGFSDSDAPSEHELALRYMLNKGVPQPDQMSTLFKTAFPNVTDSARAANIQSSPVPMPESAQELLYGQVVAPTDATTRDGNMDPESAQQTAARSARNSARGSAPTGPQTYDNRNNQDSGSSMVRDKSLGNGGYTRNGVPSSTDYGRY
jgi:hypothetical protein